MATIRKRGDLQWESRIRKKGYPVQSRTFDTKGAAEAWSRQIESEMDKGQFVCRRESENTTLSECIARYRKEITPRKKGGAAAFHVSV